MLLHHTLMPWIGENVAIFGIWHRPLIPKYPQHQLILPVQGGKKYFSESFPCKVLWNSALLKPLPWQPADHRFLSRASSQQMLQNGDRVTVVEALVAEISEDRRQLRGPTRLQAD